jgi:DNA-binding CsgD family transcriptional regulator
MQEEHINLTYEIYSEKLTQIDGREFTYREIDIIACLIHFAQANEVAQVLSIDKRTVSTHIKNIKKTLQVDSTKQILDFVTSSDKFAVFKHEYWLSLCIRIRFEQLLRKFSRAIGKEIFYYEVYHQAHNNVELLANQIKNHLKNAGFTARKRSAQDYQSLFDVFPNVDEDSSYTIYLVSEGLTTTDTAILSTSNVSIVTLEADKTSGKIIFLHPQERKTESRNRHLSLEAGAYYHSFFEILKEFHPTPKIEKLSSEFKEECKTLSDELGVFSPQTPTELQKSEAESLLSFIKKYFSTKRRWQIFAGLIFLICTISISAFFLLSSKEKKETSSSSYKSFSSPIRSDLVLPTKEILLNRSELIAQIDSKFKNNEGIQTVAVVGIGGAGKTTLARQYAHSQKLPIVWEINSETQESLMGAFESLLIISLKKRKTKRSLEKYKISKISQKERKKFSTS